MAGRGWHVFPVERGGKRPAIRAAHSGQGVRCTGACGGDGHGLHDATTDERRIRAWWQAYPGANVGVSCGPSGLVVVDVDTGKGRRPERVLVDQGDDATPGDVTDGAGVLAWLARRHGTAADLETFAVTTPTGGRHLYYAAPAGEGITSGAGVAGGLGWQVDVRAGGGYVVGPWSTRPEGLYVPTAGVPVRPLPGWLLERLSIAGRVPSRTPPADVTRAPAPVDLGARATAYLRAAVAGEIQRVLDVGEGGRNVALNRAAFALGQLVAGHGLDEAAAAEALTDAAQIVGLPAAEAKTTIRSGLSAGRRSPRGITP
ncbi:bifunctional DNA primase/polymerase [Kineosporia sp. A_224]|uniref:bifunctional DNA primase/polymerase n=1 Tax=Kineosporia sp. A_224 TaxID=1962180 RepID=UPI000B4B1F01|nr:bifunctional DNA primase/polymerase [Kineosporia sp. A_224]